MGELEGTREVDLNVPYFYHGGQNHGGWGRKMSLKEQ
jgi:hypothetical protein